MATAADNESEAQLLSAYNSTEFGVPDEGKTPPKYAWLGAAGVSTETTFESGLATQNGASYVPQVARALQTAPVIPPGAFPNGSPGTQYTATVSPASLQFAQEEATQLWQKAEAERQKAREEEARKGIAELGEGAEDPKASWIIVEPHTFIEYAEYAEHTATQTTLISVVLAAVPAVGDLAAEAGVDYSFYLFEWARVFREDAKQMEGEFAADRAKGKGFPLVYAITEWYMHIPLLGDYPVTFEVIGCIVERHPRGSKSLIYCPKGPLQGYQELDGIYY